MAKKAWVSVRLSQSTYDEIQRKHVVTQHFVSVNAWLKHWAEVGLYLDAIRDRSPDLDHLIQAVLDVVKLEAQRKQ